MVQDALRDGLVQLSCVLSMIGSGLVILTWAYPKKNRTKQGRILLLWLSLSDFLSSCIYFIQTFHPNGEDVCEVNALLGIYFPVASFLWTDCIALFLYLYVMNRNDQPLNWPKLLRNFHIFVWSISTLVVVLVYAFGHAGYANDDDGNDGKADNTGGWCWIQADNPTERFIWEIIGGKFIEWISCLVILPYLYYSVYLQLSSMEGQQDLGAERTTMDTATDELRNKPQLQTAIKPSSLDRNSLTKAPSPIPKVRSIESLYDMSDISQNEFIEQMSSRQSQTTTTGTTTPFPEHTQGGFVYEEQIIHVNAGQRDSSENRRPSTSSSGFFNKFYYKLAAVPLVLISIRIWSSLRVILQYARPHKNNADAFFEVMQAAFDPSQGIFNAILFVLASPEDRRSMLDAFQLLGRRMVVRYIDFTDYLTALCCCAFYDGSNEDSKLSGLSSEPGVRERLITAGGTRSKADSSSTGASLLGLDNNDFECDSSERMSDFSFDMT